MQDLEKTEPYKQVRREDARDVDAADLQNFLARHLQTEEKRYRDEKEVAAWIKKDPLVRFKKYLEKKKIWNTKYEEAIQKEIEGIVERNVQEYENMGVPPVEYLFNHMYKEMPPALKEQLAYIKQFERKKE